MRSSSTFAALSVESLNLETGRPTGELAIGGPFDRQVPGRLRPFIAYYPPPGARFPKPSIKIA